MKVIVRGITFFFVLSAFLCVSAQVNANPETASGQKKSKLRNNLYIVQMSEDPVVAYKGGVAGMKATQPQKGQKIDPTRPDVLIYAAYLDNRHNDALRAASGRKIYDYHYTFNGFTAELTPAQADVMKTVPGVVRVTKDEYFDMDTSSTPTFLGLTDPGGLWDMLGGFGSAGEGIIIGVIDSGVWPEGLSMSDRTGMNGNATKDGKLSYQQIPGWHGKCTPGEMFPASNCNQKLIGAQWFNASWGGDAGLKAQRPWEFASTRDYNGHGSHTSSTAGGNHAVPTTGLAAVFGAINGIAPRARVAMYKALWSTQDASTASGSGSDLVAAIDQAVADGVDVINYSISGTTTNFLDPVEIAFMNAASVGVFVTCSAGNSGPTTSTVAHPGPWLTTVAAGTHNRNGQGSAILGNNSTYYGASVANTVGPAPLINSADAGLSGANSTLVALCYAAVDNGGVPVLDPLKVAGKIVVCDRGVTARVNKSLAVKEAGGVGMILVNTSNNSINADFHSVPTVHLQFTDKPAVNAYAATPGATATINQATIVYTDPAPFTASFSSRGPLRAGNGDLLKPDVIAPGQDILAAVAPPGNSGMLVNLYSGTSMSSPHVAGLGALLKDLHPDWSPMAIKSALMTTGYDVLDGPNTNPLVIFRQGAGHVKPNNAANPGLVFDSNINDWYAFLCGATTGVAATKCQSLSNAGYSLVPNDLNMASIAIGALPGVQTVKRRVTNVGGSKATYNASFTGMTGFNVTVTPATLVLNPGQTLPFTVKFERTSAALNTYTGGQLTWTDGTHNVRTPLVVRPVPLAAPAGVSSTSLAKSYQVAFGYNGSFSVASRGLIPAVTFENSIQTGVSQSYDVVIPPGTTYARFSLFDANVSPASDLDLRVFLGTTQVGSSGTGTSAEEVNLLNPAAGTYTVYVDGFSVPGTANYTLFTWVLDSASVGNMAVSAPSTATIGVVGTLNMTFSGLTAGTKYLGSVAYAGASGMPNPTIVRVDP